MVNFRSQRGISLIMSIIILGAMMLSGIAMFRKLNAGAMIAGNLVFTNSAIAGGDAGVEAARAWLIEQQGVALQANKVEKAYYSASCYNQLLLAGDCKNGLANSFDPRTHNWAGDSVTVKFTEKSVNQAGNTVPLEKSVDQAGNTVQYVIHRLCNSSGQPTAASCVVALTTGGGSGGHETVHYNGEEQLVTPMSTYYRITTRISGPRNAVAYTQVTTF